MFYFSSDDIEIAGASPETLVKLEDKKLTTFPLAGTRPRGKTDEEDKALEEELLADAEKNLSAMWAEGFTMKADDPLSQKRICSVFR